MKYRVSDELLSGVIARYGRQKNGSVLHSHPVLANERDMARTEVIKLAWKTVDWSKHAENFTLDNFAKSIMDGSDQRDPGCIVNVGGKPILNGDYSIKSICPLVGPSDLVRREKYLAEVRERLTLLADKCKNQQANDWGIYPIFNPHDWMCDDTFESCLCYEDIKCFISIHSLYYIEPHSIFQALLRHDVPLIAAVHQFPDPIGHLGFGEATYKWDPQAATVTMSVVGNLESYSHSDMKWLWGSGINFAGGTLAWSSMSRIGETDIVMFRATRQHIPIPVKSLPNLSEALRDQRYIGTVTHSTLKNSPIMKADGGDFQVYEAIENHLFSYMGWLVIGGPITVRVSKSLVYDLAQRAAFKKRDKSLVDTLVLHARAQSRKLALSEEDRMHNVIYGVYLAQLVGLQHELNAAATFENQRSKWSLVNKFIAGETWRVPRSYIAAAAVAIGLASVLLPCKPKHKLLGLTVATGLVVSITKKPPTPGASMHRVTNVCCKGIPTEKQQVGSKVTIKEPRDCNTGFGAKLLAFGVHGVLPTVPRGCQHNDELAIKNRMSLENREEVHSSDGIVMREVDWSKVSSVFARLPYLHPLHKFPNPVRAWPFEKWLDSTPLAASRKEMLRKTRLSLRHKSAKTTGPEATRIATRDAFTKIEKLLGNPEACPRLIQGATAEYQVATGPITKSLSQRLKDTWTSDNVIWYTSGARPSGLGKFVQQLLDMPPIDGGYVFVEGDFGRYDGTQSKGSLTFELEWYEMAKIGKAKLDTLRHQWYTRGVTKNGVVYACFYKRNSGDGNTSCGNSITNGGVMIYAFTSTNKAIAFINKQIPVISEDNLAAFCQEYIRIMVLGDDNLSIVPRKMLDIGRSEQLLEKCGLRPEIKVSEDYQEIEFCSGRFYPSSLGIRWGPKIGRFIAKTGWALKPYGVKKTKQWLKGVSLGMRVDCAHIPIISNCLNKMYQVAGEAKPLSDSEMRKYRWYEHDEEAAAATEETYAMVAKLYDCTIADIKELEDLIDSVSNLPFVINHPLALRMVQVDNKIKYEEHAVVEETGPKHIPPGSSLTWKNIVELWKSADASLQMALDIVFTAPILEETLKKFTKFKLPISIGCLFLLGFEGLQAANKGNLLEFYPTAIMHMITDQLPFIPGLVVHILYNAWAFQQGQQGSFPPADNVGGDIIYHV